MNVAFDPWIPVVTLSGVPKLASLREVFTEGDKFADLAVRPHERVALMRLFLCVAHAALNGPKDYDEWCQVPARLPIEAAKYLTQWKDSFELFRKTTPWLQIGELTSMRNGLSTEEAISDWTPASKLNFSFATGANSMLFDHQGALGEERHIPLYQVVTSMVAFQCFSLGGLMGQTYWNGSLCGELANAKKETGPIKSSDAPCAPSSMLHAFLRGSNITEAIRLNMPTHEDVCLSYGEGNIGRPLWEMMPSSASDSTSVQNATTTYIGRLVPLTRFIRLHSSGQKLLLGNGLSYPLFSNGFPPEPSATVILRNDRRELLSFRPAKAIWRELASIVVKRKADNTGGPLSLSALQDGRGSDLIVSALARDKATIVDTTESVYHIPNHLSSVEGSLAYESEVRKSESLAGRLGWAVETYRKEIDGGWEGRIKSAGPSKGKLKAMLYANATTHYWTAVEENLALLFRHIEAIGTDEAVPTREIWRKMLFTSACEAYRVTCGQETPRQIRAFSAGWSKLVSKGTEANSDSIDAKEEEEA